MSLTASEIATIITKNCETEPRKVKCINQGVNSVAKVQFKEQTVFFKSNTFNTFSNEWFFIEYFLQKQVHQQIKLTPKPIRLYPHPVQSPCPFILMKYIETDSPPAASPKIAEEMGSLLGTLHSEIEYQTTGEYSIDSLQNPSCLQIEKRDWNDLFTEKMKTLASQKPAGLFTTEVSKITKKLTPYEFTISGHPTLGHLDFRPENVLWDLSESTPNGKAIIDWDKSYRIDSVYGQVLAEFFLTHMIQDEQTRTRLKKKFREGYRSTGSYFITPKFLPKIYASYYLVCLLRKIRGIPNWTKNKSEKEIEIQKTRVREDFNKYTKMFDRN